MSQNHVRCNIIDEKTAEEIITLLNETVMAHSDPENHEYNQCNIDECCWCETARKAIKNIDKNWIIIPKEVKF